MARQSATGLGGTRARALDSPAIRALNFAERCDTPGTL
jgi:hypothetical protein